MHIQDCHVRSALCLVPVIVSLLLCSDSGAGGIWKGKVVGVADGDTITVLQGRKQVIIRLHGIDTPEKAQDFGQVAKKFTAALVFGKIVSVKVITIGRYGRTVAVIHQGSKCLNEALVRAGLAWHYKRYSNSKKLAALEREARRKKRGLWAHKDPVPPWNWRRQNRGFRHGRGSSPGPGSSPGRKPGWSRRPQPRQPGAGCGKAVHGNLKSRVFHTCGCRAFRCKNCRAVFNDAVAARAAGYKGHERCTIGNPAGGPAGSQLTCTSDADCVLVPPGRCDCGSCGKRWRRAFNRAAFTRWKRMQARSGRAKCAPCKVNCATRWLGHHTACVRGQCAVR